MLNCICSCMVASSLITLGNNGFRLKLTSGSGKLDKIFLTTCLGRPLRKTLWLHASSVSQSVSQSVCQTFSIHFLHRSYLFNEKTDQVHMWRAYAL